MASRSARRGVGTRVMLAGGMIALAASLMPAHAAAAPTLVKSSIDTGWSGSDRTVVLEFDANLSAATASKSTATVTDKNGNAVGNASSVSISNNRLTFTAPASPNPDDPTLGNVYMYFRLSPFTISWTAISKADPSSTGTSSGSKSFTIDAGAPTVRLDSPTGDVSVTDFGGPSQVNVPAFGTLYTGTPSTVYGPGDKILVAGMVSDRKEDFTTNWTSGLTKADVLLTNLSTQEQTLVHRYSNVANCQPASAPTKCSGDIDMLNHSNDFPTPGSDNRLDITDALDVGTPYSLQIVASDLSGYNGYSQPINLIRLG